MPSSVVRMNSRLLLFYATKDNVNAQFPSNFSKPYDLRQKISFDVSRIDILYVHACLTNARQQIRCKQTIRTQIVDLFFSARKN